MWTKPEKYLPDNNKSVKVITPFGDEEIMYRVNALWFFEGETSYVYWQPIMWWNN